MSEIPVIDIAPFIAGDAGASDVVEAISTAARQSGFFLVTGHGVDPEATRQLYDLAHDWFDEPEADKALAGQGHQVPGGLAFAPMKQEALAGTLGMATPGDLKESLNYGPMIEGGDWPTRPAGLRAAFEAYFAEMERLSHHLRRIFASAIGLDPEYFEPAFENHLSALRVINYPEQDAAPEPGQLRAGEHTDYGFLTILRSEASPGGLQVKHRDGRWLDVPNVEGAYVVNIADAFMRWSNDTWVSTPHRVANPPTGYAGTARRQSIPFFLNPAADTMIECLPPFVGSGAKYPPVSFADYIALKTQQAFG